MRNKRSTPMTWTHFMDMHSGGRNKVPPYEHIYIEASEAEAVSVFYSRFSRNPHRVTCTCCGEDYSISDYESLEQATGFERGCKWNDAGDGYIEGPGENTWRDYTTLDDYFTHEDVLIIRAAEIRDDERHHYVEPEGYVWV